MLLFCLAKLVGSRCMRVSNPTEIIFFSSNFWLVFFSIFLALVWPSGQITSHHPPDTLESQPLMHFAHLYKFKASRPPSAPSLHSNLSHLLSWLLLYFAFWPLLCECNLWSSLRNLTWSESLHLIANFFSSSSLASFWDI